MRISKVVTRTGDKGETGLGDGSRVAKDDARIDCIGTIDELNSFIGFAKVAITDDGIVTFLEKIQNDLFNVGGSLSTPNTDMKTVDEECIIKLEVQVEEWNNELPPLREFVLPGGSEASARLHLARTMARKAERKLVGLHRNEPLPEQWLQYINRLSDVFFVLARKLQHAEGIDEKQWSHD
jgi:cob(I)alamin adenosyltransferase